MPALPSGTVTFFFTDVEGSTRLVRELGDARFAELLERHRALIREALARHSGVEFGTQGDAVFAAFERPGDAALAAAGAQQAIAGHEWPSDGRIRVRLGLHTGEIVVHGDNYVGQEVHRASRICDAGHGGQILMSERTAELVRDSLPVGFDVTALGEHRLKGLGAPERLFQLAAPGVRETFERLRAAPAPNNLPAARSSFVGRQNELSAIRAKLERGRMVTLTGIGGSGKTRLALEIAGESLGDSTDGVFFVDLAPLADADLVGQAMAEACRSLIGDVSDAVREGSLEDRLVAALSRSACLLVVDNCEHVIDEAADLIDTILARSARTKVLATSREALGIEGEQILPIPSMRLPDSGGEEDADAAEATRLFVERAQAVRPDFALDRDNRAAVHEICRRLDGIPLAIELAATRIAQLTPRQIAERLEDRFRLLAGGRRRVQRQQTLAAALDWSYDLLSDQERALLRRLAVFSGGFRLEAVEHVATGDGIETRAVLELLASLVGKSLATVDEGAGGSARYRLLETVRLYASEKLAAAGEAEAFRARQRDWVLEHVESVSIERLSVTPELLSDLAAEIENIRAAADWCIANDEPSLLARLATRLHDYWNSNFYLEGMRLLEQALEAKDRLSDDERIACHSCLAVLSGTDLSREDGYAHATAAIDLACGRPSMFLVLALGWRGFLTSILGSAPGMPAELAERARTDCARAIEIAEQNGEAAWEQRARINAGITEQNFGDHEAAAKHLGKFIDTFDAGGAGVPGALWEMAVCGLAISRHLLGEDQAANDLAVRTLAHLSKSSRSLRLSPISYRVELAVVLAACGHRRLAQELMGEQLDRLRRQAEVPLVTNHLLGVAGIVEFLRDHPARAARLLAASRSLGGAAEAQVPFRTPSSVVLYTHYLPKVRAALDQETARAERAAGRAMTIDEALDFVAAGLDLL